MSKHGRLILFGVIVGILLLLASHPIKPIMFGPNSDEGYYYSYASLIADKGPSGFGTLIDWFASSEEARDHPAPTRVGYLWPLALFFRWFGPSFQLIAFVSFVSFIVFLLISFHFLRKHFSQDIAFITVLFLASSPLLEGMSRRALMDSTVNCLWGLCVWLFLDFLTTRRKQVFVIFLTAFSVALLVKESSVVLWPFFLAASGLAAWKDKRPVPLSYLAGLLVIPFVIVGGVFIAVFGGPERVGAAIRAIAVTHFSPHQTNFYAVQLSAGPWFRYLVDFMLLSPILFLMFVGYYFLVLVRREVDFKIQYFWLYFSVVYAGMSLLPHSKVVRFVMNLDSVICLFSALMLFEFCKERGEKFRMVFPVLAAVAIAVWNWNSFVQLFLVPSLLDPISMHLLALRHFIPFD